MFAAMWLAVLFLVYAAIGQGSRIAERFLEDRMVAHLQVVVRALRPVLLSGAPLQQWSGFHATAVSILAADPSIGSLSVSGIPGVEKFFAGNTGAHEESEIAGQPPATAADGEQTPRPGASRDGLTMRKIADHYRIWMPVKIGEQTVARIAIGVPQAPVSEGLGERFDTLWLLPLILAVIFAGLTSMFAPSLRPEQLRWVQITFAGLFLAACGVVVATMVSLSFQCASENAAIAAARTLSQNAGEDTGFETPSSGPLDIDRRRGADRAVHHHPSASANPGNDEIPAATLSGQVLRSVKNFAALLIAAGFFAALFFHVGRTVQSAVAHTLNKRIGVEAHTDQDRWLAVVKPVYFLGVLAEHMTYAFLPQHVKEMALASAVPEHYAAAPFFGFYAAFALVLIPAGYAAQRMGARPLMYFGLLLAGVGAAAMTMTSSFWIIAAARSLSGVGQGMLFIGVQSYLLAVATPERKTQAAAIIVYGFHGGMISGIAVGSLMASSMGTHGTFAISALIAAVAAVYCLLTVPKAPLNPREGMMRNRDLLRGLAQAFRSVQFSIAMFAVGIPAKAVLTGIVTFGLPLLLVQSHFAYEDIGQIIMIYSICVVIASWLIAPRVDRLGTARNILFQGTLISAMGLGMIALGGSNALSSVGGTAGAPTLVLILGIVLVGIAHGFIYAPLVTYVAESHLAERIGATTATATLQFAVRAGHITGPVIIGQLFVVFHDDWSAIGFVAIAIAVLGLLFVAFSPIRRTKPHCNPVPDSVSNPKPAV
ncbi:MAG: MFS transporter [Gammaproteobacteria bacterium]